MLPAVSTWNTMDKAKHKNSDVLIKIMTVTRIHITLSAGILPDIFHKNQVF